MIIDIVNSMNSGRQDVVILPADDPTKEKICPPIRESPWTLCIGHGEPFWVHINGPTIYCSELFGG